jgi:hypothetical protein
MAYIGIPPFGQTVRTVTTFTATASQTTFNPVGGYLVGYVDVFYNGVKLVVDDDYTATNGITIVLTTGATVNDIVETVAYMPVSLTDTYRKTETVSASSTSGSVKIPTGSTAQRDVTPISGYFRFNTTTNQFEGYNGTAWGAVGGGATGGVNNSVFYENDTTITQNYTITSGKNAMSAGPITIADGVTVTVPDGSTWTIV